MKKSKLSEVPVQYASPKAASAVRIRSWLVATVHFPGCCIRRAKTVCFGGRPIRNLTVFADVAGQGMISSSQRREPLKRIYQVRQLEQSGGFRNDYPPSSTTTTISICAVCYGLRLLPQHDGMPEV